MQFNYIGRSVEYPLECRSGAAKVTTGSEALEDSITQILGVPYGSQMANPYFGSKLNRLLFNPADNVVAKLGQRYIAEALKMWEPRIQIVDIETAIDTRIVDGTYKKVFFFTLIYKVVATNETATFVYPFYRELKY